MLNGDRDRIVKSSWSISSSCSVGGSLVSYVLRDKASTKFDSPCTYSNVVLDNMSAKYRFHLTSRELLDPFMVLKYLTERLSERTMSFFPAIIWRNFITPTIMAKISLCPISHASSFSRKFRP